MFETNWLPALVIVTYTLTLSLVAFQYWRVRENRRMRERMLWERRRYIEGSDRDDISPSMIDEVLAERLGRMEAQLFRRLNASLSELSASTLEEIGRRLPSDRRLSAEDLIVEIAHGLNTPLSLIEASAINLTAEGVTAYERPARLIQNGVGICKAFLSAYRELLTLREATWSPSSLSLGVEEAVDAYCVRHATKLSVNVALPDQIPGYSNSYVLALLLPLLENAVEATPESGTISIEARSLPGRQEIDVSNLATPPYPDDRIYEPGMTTKVGHSGAGLSIVKHLLLAHQGAAIAHAITGDAITFSLVLPLAK